MVRVVVLYDEEPDPQRYEQHVELCRCGPGRRRSATGRSSARRWASRTHRYYAEWELPDQDAFKAAARQRRVRGDRARTRASAALPRPTVAVRGARLAYAEVAAGASRARAATPSCTSGPAMSRNSSASDASNAGPATRSQLLSASFVWRDRGLRAVGEPGAIASARSSSSSSGTQSETSPMRSASTPSSGSQRSRWYFAFASPQSSGQTIAAWSPAATPSFVWPSTIRRRGRRDRDVGEQPDRQARADGGAGHRRDDRLRAVDHVVDEVARLVEDAPPRFAGRPRSRARGRGRRRR